MYRCFSLLLLFACALPAASQASPDVLGDKSPVVVNSHWLAGHLHDPDLAILCVGYTPKFCGENRIPGSRLILIDDIAIDRDDVPSELPDPQQLKQLFETAGVSDSSHVVLYGERQGVLAARAYITLVYLGHDNASLLDGGAEKWKSEGRAFSRKAGDVPRGKLTLSLRPQTVIGAEQMKQLALQSPGTAAIIDSRPHDEYSGAKLSEEVTEAGHIPGAKNLYWMDLLVSKENPVLRSREELQKSFDAAGASREKPLIIYCRTGMQSSLDFLIARYLGYQPRMYDGSFYEWSRKGLPVEQSAGAKRVP